MKKFLYFSAAALTTLFAASCSSEDPAAPVPAGEGATFTINLPADLQTRTFGDGKSAPNLHYAVYAVDGEKAGQALPVFKNGTAIEDATTFAAGQLQTKVTLDLPHGVKYNIVFFACNDESKAYTFNASAGNFTVNYENMNAYSEDNDCFIYTVKDFSIQGPTSSTVTLYRPVAQLNIGTSDYAQAVAGALDPSKTQVTVNNVYKTFNFLAGGEMTDKTGVKGIKGQAEGNAQVAEFGTPVQPIAIPGDDEAFPYKDTENNITYKYMSMNYVLVGNEKDVVDVNFKLGDTRYAQVTFNNVPMQRNYRTNIFGTLLTSPADFNVIIEPDFNTPDYDYPEEVATAEDMKAALEEGKSVRMTDNISFTNLPVDETGNADIDMNGKTLTVTNYVPVNGKISIKHGNFKTGNSVAFDVMNGGDLYLKNVTAYAKSGVVKLEPNANWKANVRIEDCTLTGTDYVVATNATNAAQFLGQTIACNIDIRNTSMTGCETPLCINVPINVYLYNCTLVGSWQGAMVRGGNVTIDTCDVTTTCTQQANTTSQGGGNQVPRAALTVLNGGAYDYAATVVVTGSSLFGNTENNIPAVYALKGGNYDVTAKVSGNQLVGGTVAEGGAVLN